MMIMVDIGGMNTSEGGVGEPWQWLGVWPLIYERIRIQYR